MDWPAADDPDSMERFRQMTNLPGCFNALGSRIINTMEPTGWELMPCYLVFLVVSQLERIPRYLDRLTSSYQEMSSKIYEQAIQQEEKLKKDILFTQWP